MHIEENKCIRDLYLSVFCDMCRQSRKKERIKKKEKYNDKKKWKMKNQKSRKINRNEEEKRRKQQ